MEQAGMTEILTKTFYSLDNNHSKEDLFEKTLLNMRITTHLRNYACTQKNDH